MGFFECVMSRTPSSTAALEILQSSAQVTPGAKVVILSLTEGYKGVPSWATHLGWHSLHLRGAYAARWIQVHWAIYCAVCDQLAGNMQGALSMVRMVSLEVGVHGYCGDNLEDWCTCMV